MKKRTIAFQPFTLATPTPQMYNPVSRKRNIKIALDWLSVFTEKSRGRNQERWRKD